MKEAPITKNSKEKYQYTCPISTYSVSNIFEVIVQTGASVLPLISKYKLAGWKYKARDVFLTSSPVFRNQEINTFERFHLLLKLIDILGENQDKS